MKDMKGKRVYISGRITGNERYKEDFKKAESILSELGAIPINPVSEEDDSHDWSWWMRRDLKILLECDAILMLDGWADSVGARLENLVATKVGMDVILESDVQGARNGI